MKPKFRSLIAAFAPLSRSSLIVCASLCAATSAHADQTWTGATSAAWNDSSNWSVSIPDATENAVFDAGSTANLSIDTIANQTVGGIKVTSPSGPVSISNNTLTLGAGGIDMSAATQNLTVGSAVTLADLAAQEWKVASGRTLTVSGVVGAGIGGTVNLNTSAGGAIGIPSGTASNLLGRFAVLNKGDFVGLDASNNVVAGNTLSGNGNVTYAPNPSVVSPALATIANAGYDVIDVVNSNYAGAPTGFRLGGTATNCARGVRFNTPHATGLAWTVDNSSSRNFAVQPGASILVGSSINTDVIWNGSGTIRTYGSGQHDLYITNHSANNLLFNCGFSVSSGRSWRFTKTGTGKVIFAGSADSVTGGISINQGTVQIGNAGATGAINGGAYRIAAGATLDFNRTDTALAVGSAISGDGVVNQIGSGTVTLSGTNTHTGGTNITSGVIAASSINNFGSGDININGGGITFAGVFDVTGSNVVIGSSGATLNTNGNNISLLNPFASGSTGSLTKTGAGSLSLAADNDYSGNTVVNAGTLLADASTSSTGSGAVTINTGATLGGAGAIAGAVNITSGAHLAPGASVGTLTVGGLDLDAGSTATYEFNTTPDNDKTVVTTSGGLTIDGGAITIYQENSALPFTTPGTYNLISYSGTISGAGVSSLSVANPQAGFSYTFGTAAGNVTLTIATTGVVAQWNLDGSDSWNTATSWTPNTVPNGNGATANFSTVLTAPATVTLDGSKTVGAITFLSGAFGYTIAPGSGGSLTLNNGASDASLVNNDGSHEISVPITLTSNTGLSSLAADDGLVLSGVVSGAGTLTKTGPGSLSLLGANDFTGLLTLSGGTTTFALDGLGDGNLDISGASLIWDAGNVQDISNRTISFGADPVVFDTNGNDVALANSIGNGGAAALTKAGLGVLTFASDAAFAGDTTISGGMLQLGTGGATGLVSGNIINNAELAVNLADASTLSNLVSGTGSFVHSGTGSLTLGAQNTFSGTTTISNSGGSLILTDALNLQNSTLNYDAAGGSLNIGTLTAVTLGGLSGDKNLALVNTDLTPAAVALTVGGNNTATAYSGILSGGGSLTKVGTSELTLTGANTYTGNTSVAGGILTLGTGGEINTPAVNLSVSAVAGAQMHLTDGTLTALDGTLGVGSAGLFMEGGTVAFSGILYADGSTGSTNSGPIRVYNGSLTVPTLRLGRGGLSTTAEPTAAPADTNLYVNGGTVAVSGDLFVGTANSLPNSSVVTRVDSGSLTVGGAISIGLNNGGRWSYIDINGGELVSAGTGTNSGVVLGGPYVGKAAFLMRSGTATVERIQFGRDALDGQGLLNVSGGELYVGSEGILVGTTGVYTSEVRLSGGTLGAKANWNTAMPVNVSGTGQSTVKAADASGNPFNITLNGALTGTGGLIKNGAGTLTLTGGHSYAGNTSVFAGNLSVTTADFADTATVSVDLTGGAATLNLNFSGGDLVAAFDIDGSPQADGVYGAIGSGAQFETAAITGGGRLYVNTALPPASQYSSWAQLPINGLTAGVNDGPTQDPDNDGIENMLEFVLGGLPMTSSTAVLPDLAVNATNFVYTFTRNSDSEAEVALVFQYGSNLTGWTDVTVGPASAPADGNGVIVDVIDGTPDAITITVPRTLAGSGKLFGRVKAVK